ncbi:MAG: hypothetical protein R2783_04380 [Gelidibacter sp.]
MNDRRYRLHRLTPAYQPYHSKGKKGNRFAVVTQAILGLRCFLIDQKVIEYQLETSRPDTNTLPIMEDIRDYLRLKTLLSKKLGKVVGGKL